MPIVIELPLFQAILNIFVLHEKGKPPERVGRKATGLSPPWIWQRGCRADQHLPDQLIAQGIEDKQGGADCILECEIIG